MANPKGSTNTTKDTPKMTIDTVELDNNTSSAMLHQKGDTEDMAMHYTMKEVNTMATMALLELMTSDIVKEYTVAFIIKTKEDNGNPLFMPPHAKN